VFSRLLALINAAVVGPPEDASKNIRARARNEMKAKGISSREIEFRLRILDNTASGRVYYPDPKKRKPEARDSRYWMLTKDGYVAKGNPTDAIRSLWSTDGNGIKCQKYSALILLKTRIDLAKPERLGQLDDELRGKVIPGGLKNNGYGVYYTRLVANDDRGFQADELLAGDQIWFENPHFHGLTKSEQAAHSGEEGSNTIYIGGGKVMGIYDHEILTLDEKARSMVNWSSVMVGSKRAGRKPSKADFRIRRIRRPIIP
jgi:hypothetical protein